LAWVATALCFAMKLVVDDNCVMLGIVYKHLLITFLACSMNNKAKWKVFMINDNIGIIVQVDVHIGIHVHGIQVSVFLFTLLLKHTYFKWLAKVVV
jgi:hypothetical protein